MTQHSTHRVVSVVAWVGMDVGTKHGATDALEGRLTSCGAGAFRTVSVDSTHAYVYKRACWASQNENEYQAMLTLRADAVMRQYVSPCAIYRMDDGSVVLAMVYRPMHSYQVERDERNRFMHDLRDYNERRRAAGESPVADMHDANWRGTVKGRAVITDLGFGL